LDCESWSVTSERFCQRYEYQFTGEEAPLPAGRAGRELWMRRGLTSSVTAPVSGSGGRTHEAYLVDAEDERGVRCGG
jgi:hypothetical protein